MPPQNPVQFRPERYDYCKLGESKNHLKRGVINSIIGGFITSVNDREKLVDG
jgi:hypothetical protein